MDQNWDGDSHGAGSGIVSRRREVVSSARLGRCAQRLTRRHPGFCRSRSSRTRRSRLASVSGGAVSSSIATPQGQSYSRRSLLPPLTRPAATLVDQGTSTRETTTPRSPARRNPTNKNSGNPSDLMGGSSQALEPIQMRQILSLDCRGTRRRRRTR